MNKTLLLFWQFIMCVLLCALCATVKYRKSSYVSQAGTFGFVQQSNDSFTDLAHRMFSEVKND